MHESEKWSRSVTQSCLTLSDPMDCSPPGSPVHGIFQARVLEWGAIAFSESKSLVKLKWHCGLNVGILHQCPRSVGYFSSSVICTGYRAELGFEPLCWNPRLIGLLCYSYFCPLVPRLPTGLCIPRHLKSGFLSTEWIPVSSLERHRILWSHKTVTLLFLFFLLYINHFFLKYIY